MNYRHCYNTYTLTSELKKDFNEIKRKLRKLDFKEKKSKHKDIFNNNDFILEYYFIKKDKIIYFEHHTRDNYFKCDITLYNQNTTFLDFNIYDIFC